MHNVFARFLLDERAETRDRAGRQTPTRVGCFAVILGMLIGTSIPGRQWFATMAVALNDLADGLDRLIEFRTLSFMLTRAATTGSVPLILNFRFSP